MAYSSYRSYSEMATDNWQRETRDALWAALRADSYWRGLGGTQYDFSGKGLLQKLEIEPRHCPVTAIGPAGGDLGTVSRRSLGDEDLEYHLAVQLVTATQDVGDCEQLVIEFRRALVDEWSTLATVRGNRLYEIATRGLAYTLHPAKNAPLPMWSAELTLVCRYRAA